MALESGSQGLLVLMALCCLHQERQEACVHELLGNMLPRGLLCCFLGDGWLDHFAKGVLDGTEPRSDPAGRFWRGSDVSSSCCSASVSVGRREGGRRGCQRWFSLGGLFQP